MRKGYIWGRKLELIIIFEDNKVLVAFLYVKGPDNPDNPPP